MVALCPSKNANVIVLLTKHLKDLKNLFHSFRRLNMGLEFGSVGLLRRGEGEKNLSE